MLDLSRIDALFRRHGADWHFYLQDLRSGEVAESGVSRAWPIGSCFKLAVLLAYFEALQDPAQLECETLIKPEQFRIGVGVINFLDSAIKLTDRHLLQLMMIASDGTATDLLIARLGLERVNEVMRRHAPSAHLACDLGDMVARFRTIPGALDCKTRLWDADSAARFTTQVAALGAINARELAALALAAYRYRPAVAAADYTGFLKLGRTLPRSITFIQPAVQSFTKTGSIGRCYFLNEGGVYLDGQTHEAVAVFGFCTGGWRQPAFVVETLGGLLGIEIMRALGLTPSLNADWTPEGARLLLGDLAQA